MTITLNIAPTSIYNIKATPTLNDRQLSEVWGDWATPCTHTHTAIVTHIHLNTKGTHFLFINVGANDTFHVIISDIFYEPVNEQFFDGFDSLVSNQESNTGNL
jgi:hypothetical protein